MKHLQALLDQLNGMLGTNMKLDYAPQYGGYLLSAVPREISYLQLSSKRLAQKEMASYLIGLLYGCKLGQDVIFNYTPED